MRRFYRTADFAGVQGGWQVQLDGRGVKSVGGRAQIVPSAALAAALAAEWDGQGDELDPSGFVLRDLADFALDAVAPDPGETIAALLPYAETDTLCYRAEPGEPLRAVQDAEWEPLLRQAEQRWNARFERIGGVIHRPQPATALSRIEAELAALDPFALAALRNTASLAASLVIGLAALEPEADVPALWRAANLEHEWQAQHWGRDPEAEALQAKRLEGFRSAARFAALARA